jgi:hypothetical protein
MSTLNVAEMKVADLRTELTKRGLETTGVKAELVARLTSAIAAEQSNALGDLEDVSVTRKTNDSDTRSRPTNRLFYV